MILNQTKNKIISAREIVCKNSLSQAWGLMFLKRQNLVMVFPKEKRVSLQMWFVFYPIDVLILDSKKRIVEIKKDFKPFTFWKSSKKGKFVIELAFPGEYKVGDQLKV